MVKPLIDYHIFDGKDQDGRHHSDVMAFTKEEFLSNHDFIQWIFPTKTKSAFNEYAPLLDEETIEYLRYEITFKTRFKLSLAKTFGILGIPYQRSGSSFKISPLTEKLYWMNYDDHNLVRLTRIMESCRLLGYEKLSRNLFEVLLYSNPDFHFIQVENIKFWYKAVFGQ